jgi:peptidoglycan/LPS O-acetylase OafA/YrhL
LTQDSGTGGLTGSSYREDIDGLRSLAILPIVLFHMGLQQVPGGFVGVDVFFVISGFLISGLVARDLERGTFTFGGFLVRRLRRLYPALLVTLLVTFAFSYALLMPAQFEENAYATLASLFSVSNFYFWNETGYFDRAADSKPLLHTWSLAVEEQFYLIWPTLLLVLHRVFGLRLRIVAIVVMAAASLGAAELFMATDRTAVFYLVPFRIFEFAIGAIVALAAVRLNQAWLSHGLSLLGVFAIGASVLGFSQAMHFPGYAALLPCVGAALVIQAGPHAVANRVLATLPFRFLGKISYSLYLVHWPIVAYLDYYDVKHGDLPSIVGLTVLSIILGAILFYVVETPFRRKVADEYVVSARTISGGAFASALAATVVFSLPALGLLRQSAPVDMRYIHAQLKDGRARYKHMVRYEQCHLRQENEKYLLRDWAACLPADKKPHIAILGDSHAADLWAGFNMVYPGAKPLQFTGNACSWGNRFRKPYAHCLQLRRHQAKWIKANRARVKVVVYTQRGRHLLLSSRMPGGRLLPDRRSIARLKRDLEQFSKTTGKKVYFWGPRNEFDPMVDKLVLHSPNVPSLQRKAVRNWRDYVTLDRYLQAMFRNSRVTYIPVTPSLCSRRSCQLVLGRRFVISHDQAHWTPEGARYVVAKVVRQRKLEGILGLPQQQVVRRVRRRARN